MIMKNILAKISKKDKWKLLYRFIRLFFYLIAAVFICIFCEHLTANLKYFIGTLMLTYGIGEIGFEVLFNFKKCYRAEKFYLGIIDIVLGIVMFFAGFEYSNVCIMWATWGIMRECFEIKDIFAELKWIPIKIISGIESIVVIVFSILLLFDPSEHHAMIHLFILSLIELPINCLIPICNEFYEIKHHNNTDEEFNEEE